MVCRICHSGKHNRRTCLHNWEITTTRPGKLRRCCKRISKDRRKLRGLKIFDLKRKHWTARRKGSIAMLKRAKKISFNELDRIEKQVNAGGMSRFEKAWYDASGETSLKFDFGAMKESVMNAKFGTKDLQEGEDFAWNDGLQTVIDSRVLWTQSLLVQTLLHESFHHTVTRNRSGPPNLNDNIEHLAMALLGDRGERCNAMLGWFDCVLKDCQNQKHDHN